MMQLATIHHLVRAHLRATGAAPSGAGMPALPGSLSATEHSALLAWQRRKPTGPGVGRLLPVAGCNEWDGPPARGR